MKTKLFVTIFFALIFNAGYSITGKDLLDKIRSNYVDLVSLETEMVYNVYRGFEGYNLQEQYAGIYKREGKKSYRKIDQMEFVSDEDMMLILNHEDKKITVSNPELINTIDFDYKKTLNLCRDILVEENSDKSLVLRMILKSGTDIEYSVVELKVDKNYWIQQITFFYVAKMNFSNSYFTPEMDDVRLVITYTDLNKKWKDKDGLANTKEYVDVSFNKVTPVARLKGYEIHDYRTVSKKNK